MNYEDIALDWDALKSLEETLRVLRISGFSSQSSPVSLLFEALIDINLALWKAFKEGRPKSRRNNPEVIFLEQAKANELGNSPQISRFENPEEAWNPEASEFFKMLARFFVFMKKSKYHFSKKDFMSYMEMAGIFPVAVSRLLKVIKNKNPKNQKKTERQKANQFYYRRRRK